MTFRANPELVAKLAVANRILARQGVVDGFGHISVRVGEPDAGFLLSRSLAPARVTAKDIMCFDLEGNALDGDTRKPYLELFIHSEIYRLRPDVRSVVHNHSPSVIPYGVTHQALRPIFHMAGFLGPASAHFDIRDEGGNTDLLVRNRSLGASLARALGSASVVLMRGHGCTVVAGSIEQVVYRSVYTELNAATADSGALAWQYAISQ